MANYYIIGGDAKEYGPISGQDIELWIREGRLNAQSMARSETVATWTPLGSFPEFAAALQAAPPTIAPPPPSHAGQVNYTGFVEQDYELDLGGCISQGYELVKGKIGVFFVGALIYLLIQMGISGAAQIPILGLFVSLASFVIKGPLMGGLLYFFLRGVRGEEAAVEDIFSGFKRAFGHLFLAMLVQGIILGLCMSPFLVVFTMKFINSGLKFDPTAYQSDPQAFWQFLLDVLHMLVATLPVLLICALPVIYLSTCWQFSLALIMDKGMDFWTAMKTSFKMVNKHWFQVFGLVILVGLINLVGFILCCVPFLFTFPIRIAALMYGYETIFGAKK